MKKVLLTAAFAVTGLVGVSAQTSGVEGTVQQEMLQIILHLTLVLIQLIYTLLQLISNQEVKLVMIILLQIVNLKIQVEKILDLFHQQLQLNMNLVTTYLLVLIQVMLFLLKIIQMEDYFGNQKLVIQEQVLMFMQDTKVFLQIIINILTLMQMQFLQDLLINSNHKN